MNEQNNNINPNPQINNIPPQQPINQGITNQQSVEPVVNSNMQQATTTIQEAPQVQQVTTPIQENPQTQPVTTPIQEIPQVQQAINPQPVMQPVNQQPMNVNQQPVTQGQQVTNVNTQQPTQNIVQQVPIQQAEGSQSGFDNGAQQMMNANMQQPIQDIQTNNMQQPVTPIQNSQPTSTPNNGVFAPSVPIGNNDVTNVGFVASSYDMPKKKNKGLIIGIVLFIIVALGALGYFVIYPFIMKTYFNNPKNVYETTIKSAFKNISTTTNDLVHNKAIYDVNVTFDSNIETFKDFSGYTFNVNIGVDPENKLLQEEFSIKDANETDHFYKYYLKNNKIYEKYSGSIYHDYIYRGEANPESANDLFKLFNSNDLFETSNKLDNDEFEYVVNKLSDIIIGSIDENKLSKEDSSVTINGKTLKVTNNKYKIDKETISNTTKYIKDEISNDDKTMDIIAKLMDIEKSELKDALKNFEIDEELENEDNKDFYYTVSIYTYGTKNEIVGFAMDSSDDNIDVHYYFKDEAFEFRVRSNTENEVTGKMKESVLEAIGKKEGNNTKISVKLDDKEIIEVLLRQFDDKGIDFDYTIKDESGNITGTIKYEKDINDDRAKLKLDASVRMGKEYITLNVDFEENWTADVANILTDGAKTLTDEEITKVQEDFMKSLAETPLFKALFTTSGDYDPSISDYYDENGYESPNEEDWNI